MNASRVSHVLASLACLGMILPASWIEAAESSAPTPTANAGALGVPAIVDVALSEQGTLQGSVIDPQGSPVPRVSVIVGQTGQAKAYAQTGAEGQFSVSGLRGGVYQVMSGQGAGTFRLWAADTAPPGARHSAMIVTRSTTVRGQMPMGDFFATDAFIISAIVVTAVAIPVAIHNFRNDHRSGS
jgi:hypothetical protein